MRREVFGCIQALWWIVQCSGAVDTREHLGDVGYGSIWMHNIDCGLQQLHKESNQGGDCVCVGWGECMSATMFCVFTRSWSVFQVCFSG